MKTPKLLFRLALTLSLLLTAGARAQTPPNNALNFNGINQFVTVTNFGAIVPTNEITVEVWVYANVIAGQTAFAMNFGTPSDRFAASISYPSSDYWDFGNLFGSAAGRLVLPQNPVGKWTHYAFVVSQSGNYMTVYTNGVLLATRTGMTPFVRGNYDLTVGGAGVSGMEFNGWLTEFRVWNTARSQSQIQANFTNTLVGNEPNLFLYYKFDATNGTVATNFATATGAAYNGALINSPTWSSPFFIVTNLADSGPGTLRQAVSNTFGSKITFAPNLSGQAIVLTNGQITFTRSMTVDASALANGIRLDGNGASRIFQITNAANVVLNSLTFTNGSQTTSGGAILNQSANLTVTNCTFANNVGAFGGAIFNDTNGAMNLDNCAFHGNQTVYNQFSSGQFGGQFGGGALFNFGAVTVSNCTFANNLSSVGSGGAIFNGNNGQSGTLAVNSSVFYGNQTTNSQYGGGAMFNFGTMTVINSTFFGNQANTIGPDGGGAILNILGTITVNDCTLFGNQVSNPGSTNIGGNNIPFENYGGIEGSSVSLSNSIVCGNTANTTNANCNPTTVASGANNLVDTNPLLAPLGNYGGPTLTMPPLAGSPAIDAGNDAAASFLATDQRGFPRHVGLHVDIGAVETQGALTLSATGVSAVAATLNGNVTTTGSYYFACGLTTNYTSFTTTNTLSTPVVSAPIAGLADLTTYHFQLVVTNSSGIFLGGDQTFTTLVLPGLSGFAAQVLATNAATGSITVQLSANVNSSGLGATLNFQYGLTSAYGAIGGPVSQSFNSPAANLAVAVGNLVPGNTYHWNAVATNSGGSTVGADQTFTLAGPGSGIRGDLNGDGIVSLSELNTVYANYATNAPWLLITNAAGLGGTNVTFMISNGVPNTYSVQYTTNLASPNWIYLGPAIPFYGFTDSNAPAGPQRFYRLHFP